eukprot:Sspe_Gene.48113::Locus_24812_Transcript_1_1_Confidence_1.000_Length_2252::g.48113::m.48113
MATFPTTHPRYFPFGVGSTRRVGWRTGERGISVTPHCDDTRAKRFAPNAVLADKVPPIAADANPRTMTCLSSGKGLTCTMMVDVGSMEGWGRGRGRGWGWGWGVVGGGCGWGGGGGGNKEGPGGIPAGYGGGGGEGGGGDGGGGGGGGGDGGGGDGGGGGGEGGGGEGNSKDIWAAGMRWRNCLAPDPLNSQSRVPEPGVVLESTHVTSPVLSIFFWGVSTVFAPLHVGRRARVSCGPPGLENGRVSMVRVVLVCPLGRTTTPLGGVFCWTAKRQFSIFPCVLPTHFHVKRNSNFNAHNELVLVTRSFHVEGATHVLRYGPTDMHLLSVFALGFPKGHFGDPSDIVLVSHPTTSILIFWSLPWQKLTLLSASVPYLKSTRSKESERVLTVTPSLFPAFKLPVNVCSYPAHLEEQTVISNNASGHRHCTMAATPSPHLPFPTPNEVQR